MTLSVLLLEEKPAKLNSPFGILDNTFTNFPSSRFSVGILTQFVVADCQESGSNSASLLM
ncbi:hypothetical protein ACLOJK_019357 [Asimina triloba]